MKFKGIYILFSTLIILVIIILQLFYLENRLALKIHLRDCNYPSELKDIKIINRLSILGLITHSEDYSSATFYLEKKSLKEWLKNSDFEVLSFIDKSSVRNFIKNFNNIPEDILTGNEDFFVQFLHSNNERTVAKIQKVDKDNNLKVNLYYCVT